MLILLLVVSVYPAGVLVVQLQALLTGRGFAVLRHHKNVLKNCQQPPYDERSRAAGEGWKNKENAERNRTAYRPREAEQSETPTF